MVQGTRLDLFVFRDNQIKPSREGIGVVHIQKWLVRGFVLYCQYQSQYSSAYMGLGVVRV